MSTTFLEKYKVIQKIGEGTFSDVLKCQNRITGILFAGKRLKKTYQSANEILESPEVIAMKQISRHPNILYMIECHYDPLPGKVTLIFELMEMSLYDLIRGRKGMKILEQRIRLFVYQLLKGLDHLHKHGIFHRDIKPENILVKGVVVKLADLGSIRGIYSRPPYTEYISTRWYRSPECLLTTGFYGPKMDIWALGCVYYELLTLKPLFPGSNEIDQISKIHDILGTPNPRIIARFRRHRPRNCEYFFPNKPGTGISLLIPAVSESGKEVLKMMLIYDPENRSNVKRLLEHRYFRELRESDPERLIEHSGSSQETSKWRNPVLLSYITSEKRRKYKPLGTQKPQHCDGTAPKISRTVDSRSTTQENVSVKLEVSKMAVSDSGLDSVVKRNSRKSWKRNAYSTKTEKMVESPVSSTFTTRLPIIKQNRANQSQENGVARQGAFTQRIPESLSFHSSLQSTNFHNAFEQKNHNAKRQFTFLPEIMQKPYRRRPTIPIVSAPQSLVKHEADGRKTKLATIAESRKPMVHTRSPNPRSPVKKMAKQELTTSCSTTTISSKKIFAAKKPRGN